MTQSDAPASAVADSDTATATPTPAVDLRPQQSGSPGVLSTRRWALWTVLVLAVTLAAAGAIRSASPGSDSQVEGKSPGVASQGPAAAHVSGVQHRQSPVRRTSPHAS
jgi:hypothetical protein